ncbi:hypothetical protein J2X36_000850 [Methylobacterium sp. BE186]|uniref:hypothetical protein n=1 Tax=Methylobacterium sp. BE186 TaxID=2817715 RepID=UPI00285C90D3|nr:hypothetical protein [Methylobacterium sp. BE186]MDR7036114.1 hypothetical protein [Methylobacterium sp. BE186]
MTPAQSIAALDRQIAQHGQDVQLRAAAADPDAAGATVRAFVRGYRPEELGGGVQQGDTLMILSPTHLAAVETIERGDGVTVAGRARYVEVANPVVLNDVVVRIECTVRG